MRRFLSPKIYFFAFLFIAAAWAFIAYREATQSHLPEAAQESPEPDIVDSTSPNEMMDSLPKEIMEAIDATPTSSLPAEEVILPDGTTLKDAIDRLGLQENQDSTDPNGKPQETNPGKRE